MAVHHHGLCLSGSPLAQTLLEPGWAAPAGFVGARRALWAEMNFTHVICVSSGNDPPVHQAFLHPALQWVDVWQQAVPYTPLNVSPDPGSWWELQHFGIELLLSNWPHWLVFLGLFISCSVWCVDDFSLLWKSRCFELPIILHKVKLFAQPRGCLGDLLQTADRSMSLRWGMSKGQECECWNQKNETTWLQHLSKGRRLWNISLLLCAGYRILEP